MNNPNRLFLFVVTISLLSSSFAFCGEDAPRNLVTVVTEKDGDGKNIMVTNNAICPVTVTLELSGLDNAEVSEPMPRTVVIKPGESGRLAAMRPIDPSKPYKCSYDAHWMFGSYKTVPHLGTSYLLPYSSGSAYMIIQGYDGDFSHFGEQRYAIDWEMPEGTEIHAARDGMVIKVIDSFTGAGTTKEYRKRANLILVLHRDGTIAEYAHIQRGGSRVSEGQAVSGGDLIALSGNVGYSLGPHLHFCVFIPVDGKTIKSIPVTFKTKVSDNSILTVGRSYEAP